MTSEEEKPEMAASTSSLPSVPFFDDMYKIYVKRRRQPRIVRILLGIFLIVLCYLLTMHSYADPLWPGDKSLAIAEAEESVPAKPMRLFSHHDDPTPELDLPDTDAASEEEEDAEDEDEEGNTLHHRPDEKDAATLKFEAGLKHIFTTAPDEIHVRELLRPIEGTGKERLRETGVRARAFRALFESWEELHVVVEHNVTYVRDDVVTYLRKAEDLSGISTIMTRADMIRSYENYRFFLTRLSALLFPWTAPYFADHMMLHAHLHHGERGIVLSAGDGQLKFVLTSIKTFRKLGCMLPIEIMYLGDDDLGDDSRSELEALPGVVTRDMKQMVNDQGWDLKGWAGKPFAILLSSFREVLFVDADALFFVNPEVLFEDPDYEKTGALFFRDRLMFPESKKKWLQQVLPKPISKLVRQSRFWTGESGHMQESGVVVVDKWRHFMALLMVTRMNGPDRDGNKDKGLIGTYDMVYGDKETFWLGWELVGDTDYAFHSGDAGNMGVAYADRGDSPKIADTVAHIGKHKNLGALAGSYELTMYDQNDLPKPDEGEGGDGTTTDAADDLPEPEPEPEPDAETESDEPVIKYDDDEEEEAEKKDDDTPSEDKADGEDDKTTEDDKKDTNTDEKTGESEKDDQEKTDKDDESTDATAAADAKDEKKEEDTITKDKSKDANKEAEEKDPEKADETDAAEEGESKEASEDDKAEKKEDYDEKTDADSPDDVSAEDPTEVMPTTKKRSKRTMEMVLNKRTSASKGKSKGVHKAKSRKKNKGNKKHKTPEEGHDDKDATDAKDTDDKKPEEEQDERPEEHDADDDMKVPVPLGQPIPASAPQQETNYTICSPQLLHLDRKGRPLWFNGWILQNKFVEKGQVPELTDFRMYMRETRMDHKTPASWTLQSNNMCCLSSDKLHRFTDQEKETLRMIVKTARDVGAVPKE